MKVKEILSYVKVKVSEYPKMDSIIEGLELSKETEKSKDINSFIRSKNKVSKNTEEQVVRNINLDKKIDEYKKWQNLIRNELEELRIKDSELYKIVIFKITGYSFEKIKSELYLGERTVINMYNNFVIHISLLAVKGGLIHI